MDPVTHALAGAVLSRTGFYQRFGRTATIIFLAAALIPDIDHFSLRIAGPLAYLKYHRGFTHSIIGSFIIAAAIAAVTSFIRPVKERMAWPTVFSFSLLGIYSHIFLDLITSYGTLVFFPFSDKRYSLDLVFIIDFYFTVLLLIPLIIMKFKKEWAKFMALASVACITIYLGIAYIERNIAIKNAKREALKLGITVKRVEAIPLPLSPFKWSVYIDGDKMFYQIDTDVLKNNLTFNSFEKKHIPESLNRAIEGSNIIEKVKNMEIVKTYLWFARFPVVAVKEQGSGYLIEYFDLRFNSLPPRKPFLLQLFVDKNGGLSHAELMFHTIK